MRTILTIIACFAFGTQAMAQIAWTDLKTARQEAATSGKLLLLHFYSDDCVFCEKLESGAYQNPAVIAAINENFVPVRIYGPTNAAAAEQCQVTGYPTDVIMVPMDARNGKVLLKVFSPQDPQGYVSMLNQAENNHKTMLAQLEAKPLAMVSRAEPAVSSPAPKYPEMPPPPSFSAPLNGPDLSAVAPVRNPYESNTSLTSATLPKKPEVKSPINQPANSTPIKEPTAAPSIRMESEQPIVEGYCMVTMIDEQRWQLGNPRIGAMHLGRLYLFANTLAREKFLAAPDMYAPVMGGLDVVRFFDEGKIVPGIREFGSTIENQQRTFFFSSEATLQRFEAAEQYRPSYSVKAIELTERAAAEANR